MHEEGADATVRLETTTVEHVAVVRIHRPKARNALDTATRMALIAKLREAHQAGARCIILTGTERSFAAGADLKEMVARTPEEQRAYLSLPRLYETVEGLPVPVIAAINGHALGAGLELALACDMRLASENAKLGSPEVRLGIIPGGGGTQRLPRLVGLGEAFKLILTGEAIDAREAHRLGLVQEVVPPEALEARAIELAASIARWSPVALAAAKKAIRTSLQTTLARGLNEEVDLFVEAFSSKDAHEGITAFLDKREPHFQGR